MKVIVGLGNPGRQYEQARHNVGWMVLDRLAAQHQTTFDRKYRHIVRVDGVSTDDVQMGNNTVKFFKPTTMMNRSGSALAHLKGVQPEQMLLVCDDVNLPLGRLRLRAQGSAGGHRGLASCLQALGTEQVNRLRIGVGGGHPGADLTGHVLSAFTEEERPALEEIAQRAAQAIETWIEEGIEVAMNRYNPVQD